MLTYKPDAGCECQGSCVGREKAPDLELDPESTCYKPRCILSMNDPTGPPCRRRPAHDGGGHDHVQYSHDGRGGHVRAGRWHRQDGTSI